MGARVLLSLALLIALLPLLRVQAQVAPVLRYDAIDDRQPRPEPSLPALGGAGSSFFDPVFATPMWRVTDAATRPSASNRSYRTPSGTHQNAWSADGAYFYVVSTDGTIVPYAFDATTERARRIDAESSGEGGFVLRFYIEPHFSYSRPGIIYGSFSGSGGTLRTIDQYDFARKAYDRLLDLDTLVPGLGGTYIGGLGSGGDVERLVAFFGGASQDRHKYVVAFERANPSSRHLVDTIASTLDGRPTNIPLKFSLHHAFIDRSGRYVMLYPTAGDYRPPRNAAPVYIWDVDAGTFTELPAAAARSSGHDAYGYGVMVNQDCCTATSWDAAQWQFRSLSGPLATRDLITTVLQPKSVFLSDHPSWHNARRDLLMPFVTALFRYGGNDVPWRAWDDEIVAVETSAGQGANATVWRFAHHRSDVAHDDDRVRNYFWYMPRPNVSQDGRWVLFTSNWEKRLGTDPGGEAGGRQRQDVFLLKLRTADGPPPPSGTLRILTTTLPSGRRGQPYSATLMAAGGTAVRWRVTSGSLPPGVRLDGTTGVISGTCVWSGTWTFTVTASDGTASDRSVLSLTLQK